jgi:glycosyltransferase involved in cell wall biosynthesis
MYKDSIIPENQIVLANSEFTKRMIQQYYPDYTKNIKVLYPPVDLERWQNDREKLPETISSLGRFSRDKRQLEQIKIAEQLPALKLNIIGFIGDRHGRSYFNLCKNYLDTNRITNVTLYPNLAFADTKELLASSKFFIHSLRNEPFGISSVEAIAAGCIPVVHDSGGQQEIVKFSELRYKNSEEAVQKINGLLKKDLANIQKDLVKDNSRFTVDVFDREMKAVLF